MTSVPSAAPPRYALAIFDFDGVLADSAPWFGGVLNEVARRYKFREVREEDRELLRRMDTIAICRHLGLPLWKLPFVARHMRKLAARDIAQIAPFQGAGATLAALHAAGVRLAIVSSNARANIERVLGREAVSRVEIFACGTSTFGKAARFRKVLKRAGVTPSAAIAIGDEIRDLDAAVEAGLAAAAVSWGYAAPELLASRAPRFMFERMEDIVPAIVGGAA